MDFIEKGPILTDGAFDRTLYENENFPFILNKGNPMAQYRENYVV